MVGLFIGLLIAGLALIGWGAASNQIIISAIGGALFGSSISSLVSSINSGSLYNKVITILESSLGDAIHSEESKISPFRKKLYFYHVSEVDGKRKWKFDVLDFSSSPSIGTLETRVETQDAGGNKHVYRAELMVRDSRVILFRKAVKGNETLSVAVLPHMGEVFHKFHCGVIFKKSWSATNILAPCIVSNQPLIEYDFIGTNANESHTKQLDEKWSDFLKKNELFITSEPNIAN